MNKTLASQNLRVATVCTGSAVGAWPGPIPPCRGLESLWHATQGTLEICGIVASLMQVLTSSPVSNERLRLHLAEAREAGLKEGIKRDVPPY